MENKLETNGFTIITVTPEDLPLKDGICGIAENIRNQWGKSLKTFGYLGEDKYMLMSTTDFSNDHFRFRDLMDKEIEKPKFLIAVDETGRKVTVSVSLARPGEVPETDFEKSVIKEILTESREAFSTMPEGTRMQVDVDSKLLDSEDIQLTRAKSVDELKKQIELLK